MIILYKAFNVDIGNYFKPYGFNKQYYECGHHLYTSQESFVNWTLDKYLLLDGSIDASQMSRDWFPEVNADVFISHSHKDIKDVVTFAGWLNKKLGLTAFVDSLVWGYADDLLKRIDNSYCLKDDGHYSYKKRNISTAHVHMMLQVALMNMMDKTECLFFINTPNSIKIKDNIYDKVTSSAWIYSELSMYKCILKRPPKYMRKKGVSRADELLMEQLNFNYPIDISEFQKLSHLELAYWKSSWEFSNDKKNNSLSLLYELDFSKLRNQVLE